jgi:hypothetical protein
MLKIWLTCLQPSLGILGAILVLSNAVAAHAGAKASGIVPKKISKAQSQQKAAKPSAPPQQFGAKGTGIVMASTPKQGVRVMDYRVSVTPDAAVRQLALDTIANSQRKAPTLTAKTSQQNTGGLSSFISPSPVSVSSITPKSTNAKFVRPSVTTETQLVSGLFTGNSTTSTFDRPIENFPNLAIPSSQAVLPVIAQPIASVKVAQPSLEIVSEQIKPTGSAETVVAQATRQSNSSATAVPKGLEQFLGNEPKSIQPDPVPDTTVASGLQQFLGNEPKSIQTDSMSPVAKATPVKVDSTLALSELVSPSKTAARTTNTSGLQLATSRAYDTAADFNLPGVATQLQAVKTAQPKVKLLAIKTVKTNLAKAVVQRKNDYVALMSDKSLKSPSQQSWTTARQGNSLGGLILGSPSTTEIASLPMNVFKANDAKGLGLLDSTNQY